MRRALTDLRELGCQLDADRRFAPDLFPDARFSLSAGGSTYADVVLDELAGPGAADAPWRLVHRAGGLAFSDHGFVGEMPHVQSLGLHNAAEVWAHVLSRPEPGRAIVSAGRRDLSFDQALPTVLRAAHPAGSEIDCDGIRVAGLNDQHCLLEVPVTFRPRRGRRRLPGRRALLPGVRQVARDSRAGRRKPGSQRSRAPISKPAF